MCSLIEFEGVILFENVTFCIILLQSSIPNIYSSVVSFWLYCMRIPSRTYNSFICNDVELSLCCIVYENLVVQGQ